MAQRCATVGVGVQEGRLAVDEPFGVVERAPVDPDRGVEVVTFQARAGAVLDGRRTTARRARTAPGVVDSGTRLRLAGDLEQFSMSQGAGTDVAGHGETRGGLPVDRAWMP